MNRPAATLCLNMIVRNESAVIERCLASVKPLISRWVIVDTGSTDDTAQRIRRCLHDVPGRLVERPWVDFGHNRNEALGYAAGCADYLLMIDADEVLELDPGYVWPELTADGYTIETRLRGLSYRRLQLVRNSGDWRYHGVVHEYLASPNSGSIEPLAGIVNRPHQDGARSADPHKFRRDALVLEAALLDEPDNARHVLYLANSYRDAHDYDAALARYRRRAGMGGDAEEVWYAAYQAALMRVLLDQPWEQALEALLQAWALRPSRAEPLYHAALHYRSREQYVLAGLFAERAAAIPHPAEGLFIETEIYAYRIAFESAIACYWAGRHGEAVRLNNRVLAQPEVASEVFAQALKNRRYSLQALQRDAARPAPEPRRFCVFVPMRDPGTAFDNCIASLLRQRGANFTMHFVDFGSRDGSHRQVPLEDPRATLVRTDALTTLAEARHRFLVEHCEPDDVFVHLNGTDWLAHGDVLATLGEHYGRQGCEVLYGQYRHSDGSYGRSMPHPDEQAFPHLIQTFRVRLYRGLAERDPGYASLKDTQGRWVDPPALDDRPLMVPLLRLAGPEAVCFNDEVLYVLNTDRG